MHLSELFDLDQLENHITEGYVRRQTHDTEPLTIYNYTHVAQFDNLWDDITTKCRGLIVDDSGTIVARPFPKFFNYGQVPMKNVPTHKPCLVYEKMDGSLGISYPTSKGLQIATRGSFSGPQAQWASQRWETHYSNINVPEGFTALFEIIYQQGRIVVDYRYEDLVLLAVIEIETGIDIPLWEVDWWEGRKATLYPEIKSLEESYTFGTGNKFTEDEGIVVAWFWPDRPAYRLKVKHPEYLIKHKAVFGLSTTSIWELCAMGGDLKELAEILPDEFYDWAKETFDEYQRAYKTMFDETVAEFREIEHLMEESRKKFALRATKSGNASLLFMLADEKSLHEAIWKRLKPVYAKAAPQLDENL